MNGSGAAPAPETPAGTAKNFHTIGICVKGIEGYSPVE